MVEKWQQYYSIIKELTCILLANELLPTKCLNQSSCAKKFILYEWDTCYPSKCFLLSNYWLKITSAKMPNQLLKVKTHLTDGYHSLLIWNCNNRLHSAPLNEDANDISFTGLVRNKHQWDLHEGSYFDFPDWQRLFLHVITYLKANSLFSQRIFH